MHDIPPELHGRPFAATDAAKLGVSRRMLDGRRYAEVYPGVFRTRDTPITFDLLVRAAVIVLPEDAALSHITNLRWRGYDGVPERPLHFSTNTRVHVERSGIIVHRRQDRFRAVLVNGVRLLGPNRTFVDSATLLGPRDLLRVGDWLVARGLSDLLELRSYVVTEHLDGVQRARVVAPLVRAGVESVRESDVRGIIMAFGLPVPVPNPDIFDEHGRFLARGDLVYRAQKVVVEYDGWQHERDARQRQHDHLRRERLEAEGWRVIVVTAEDFRDERAIAWRIYDALRLRGYTGDRPRFGR